ncbi:hypothetical protein GWI33_019168 [Rhynchophorus ferrugineus]|uniref:Cuticle protein n=1 Tax=Rhynchophorus ferrugineus TaxID=354439 RepID=A0A834HSD3_RHYFE|nr:hypothetical protein GWI33_019168 [Rhynchophorus ferrugineus]
MNSFVVVAFFACLAACNAGLLVGPSAKVLQGPSSKTTLVGPEGSVISAHAPGGQIVHEEHPGFVAHAAPVVAYVAPAVAHAAPSAHSSVVAHSSAYEHEHVVVAGPSGSISTGPHSTVVAHATPVEAHAASVAPAASVVSHSVSVVAHSAPVIAHAVPVVAHAAPVVAYAAPVAHADVDNNGHEGQYVHDHSETLYDDGSYKPHAYHH